MLCAPQGLGFRRVSSLIQSLLEARVKAAGSLCLFGIEPARCIIHAF